MLNAPIGYFFAFLAAKYGVQSPVSSALAFSLSRLLITAAVAPLNLSGLWLPWFLLLEKHVTTNYHVIQTQFDMWIPFVEYFIIPYLMWFAFIAAAFVVFFLYGRTGFYKMAKFMFTGMTIFLSYRRYFRMGRIFVRSYLREIMYLWIWCGCCIVRIHVRMYSRVCMYLIR